MRWKRSGFWIGGARVRMPYKCDLPSWLHNTPYRVSLHTQREIDCTRRRIDHRMTRELWRWRVSNQSEKIAWTEHTKWALKGKINKLTSSIVVFNSRLLQSKSVPFADNLPNGSSSTWFSSPNLASLNDISCQTTKHGWHTSFSFHILLRIPLHIHIHNLLLLLRRTMKRRK